MLRSRAVPVIVRETVVTEPNTMFTLELNGIIGWSMPAITSPKILLSLLERLCARGHVSGIIRITLYTCMNNNKLHTL